MHQLDLANEDAVQSLEQLILAESHRIALIWAAVPHSTVSSARSKPIPKLEKLNVPVPKPLRSSMHPHGLDGLSGLDKQKCELANQVYQSTTRLLAVALDRGVRCVLENPVSSLFWQTDYFKSLQALHAGAVVHFHMCQHGGPRPKNVQLWASDASFASLAAVCPGSKTCNHEPWQPSVLLGATNAGPPAAYPSLFCDRVAGMLKQACPKAGVQDRAALCDSPLPSNTQVQRLVLGLQPAGGPLAPVAARVWPLPAGCRVPFRCHSAAAAQICFVVSASYDVGTFPGREEVFKLGCEV